MPSAKVKAGVVGSSSYRFHRSLKRLDGHDHFSCDLSLAAVSSGPLVPRMQALVSWPPTLLEATLPLPLAASPGPVTPPPPHPGPVTSRPLQHDLNKGASLIHYWTFSS